MANAADAVYNAQASGSVHSEILLTIGKTLLEKALHTAWTV